MRVTSYVIMVEPSKLPKFYLLEAGGSRRVPIGAEVVPAEVLMHAAWLVALVEGRPLPPDPPPPAIFGDIHQRKRIFAIVTCEDRGPDTVH